MPRGGRRTGTPGQSYSNRTDLNVPAMAAKGQQYGAAGAQMASQAAVPVSRPATDVVPTSSSSGQMQGNAPPASLPGQLTPLDAPSMRPGEPVTAGLPVGPGAGPEANLYSQIGSPEDGITALRAAYAAYPSESIRQILEGVDLGG